MNIFSWLYESKEARQKRIEAKRLAEEAEIEEIKAKRLNAAERDDENVLMKCEECGNRCLAQGRPVEASTVLMITQAQAMSLSRFCAKCNIAVCGKCTGVSVNPDPYIMTSYPCPRCRGNTIWTAACHLRGTRTQLLD